MPTQHETLTIMVGGTEIQDVYADLVRLEVELDEDLAGMFRLTLPLLLRADGTWTYLDDERSSRGKVSRNMLARSPSSMSRLTLPLLLRADVTWTSLDY